MDSHAAKSVFVSVMTTVGLFTSMGEPFKSVDQPIIHFLSVVLGDASVWPNVFQEIRQARAVAVRESTKPFPGQGLAKRKRTAIR